MVEDVRKHATNQIPVNLTVGTNNDNSEIYVGDWPFLLIGVRHNLQIDTLRERYADAYQYGFLAHLRADIQLAQPKGFSVIHRAFVGETERIHDDP